MNANSSITSSYNTSKLDILCLSNICLLVIMKYVFYFWISHRHRIQTGKIISPKNFTLLCKIQTEKLSPEERLLKIEDLVKKIINPNSSIENIDFLKINPIFEIKDFIVLISQLLALEKKITIIQKKIENNLLSRKKILPIQLDLQNQKKTLRAKLSHMTEHMNPSNYYKFTGWVFITFKTLKDLKNASYRKSPLLKSFFWKFNSNWRTVPEPADIIWENWSIPWTQKILKRIGIFLIVFVTIAANFGIILGFKSLQNSIAGWIGDDSSIAITTLQIVVSIAISILIGVVNFIIRLLLIYFTKFESYKTYTTHYSEIVFKVVLLQFVNKALIVLLSNKIITSSNKWQIFGSSGVVGTMIISMIINVFFDVIVYLVEPAFMIKLWKRRLIKKDLEGKMKLEKPFLQIEANEVFEGTKFDISEAYYLHFTTLCLAFFYQAIIPYGLLLGMVECILKYNIVKYVLIKRSVKPHDLEIEFTQKMFRQFEFTVLLMALGFVVFSTMFQTPQQSLSVLYIISICIAGMDWMVSTRIIQMFANKPWHAKIEHDFSFYELCFPADYDRLNPITQKKAFREFLRKLNQGPQPVIDKKSLEEIEDEEDNNPEFLLNDYAIFHDDRLNNANVHLNNAAIFTNYFKPTPQKKNMMNYPSLYAFQSKFNNPRYKTAMQSISPSVVNDQNRLNTDPNVDPEREVNPRPNIFISEFAREAVRQSVHLPNRRLYESIAVPSDNEFILEENEARKKSSKFSKTQPIGSVNFYEEKPKRVVSSRNLDTNILGSPKFDVQVDSNRGVNPDEDIIVVKSINPFLLEDPKSPSR